ncbi:MAG: hypothetical protein ACLS6O_04045 [Bifidobacterium sp.]
MGILNIATTLGQMVGPIVTSPLWWLPARTDWCSDGNRYGGARLHLHSDD